MTLLHRTAVPAVVALLAGLALAGCGNAPGSAGQAPAGSAATSGQDSGGGTTEGAQPTKPGKVELPWPADRAADAAALQAAADAGSQPWLLDPAEVAISYVAAAHGWTSAEASPGPDGTTVDVSNADGERLTLTLAQPARTGPDGVWVVTAEQPA